ncbi:MAG: glycerophosphodiester phosphodiesterase [Candidatus Riflebacteria bacterium]|nr:glycerophosphodiester phosphodiesterase [Candidatus Riflebacteria bacterium]
MNAHRFPVRLLAIAVLAVAVPTAGLLAQELIVTDAGSHDPGPAASHKVGPWVIAHRGASEKAPENTMAAFRQALEDGADVLETDAQTTADGRLILLHDDRLDRTTDGTGIVADQTLAQLRALDAGSWKDRRFAGERLATLEELAALVRKTGVGLVVEAKTVPILDPGLAKRIVQVLEREGVLGTSVVQSFDHRPLAHLHALRPDVMTAPLVDAGIDQIGPIVRSTGAFAYLPNYAFVLPDRVAHAHSLGVKVCPWTVDDPAHMRMLIDAGVDGIMTNRPHVLSKLLADLGLARRPWPR